MAGWVLRGFRAKASASAHTPVKADTADADYLRAALDWGLRMSGARRVVLWRSDAEHALMTPFMSAGGARPAAQTLTGDPLTWVATENVSLRIEPRPVWSDAEQVFALPIDVGRSSKHVLTIELSDQLPVKAEQFEGLAIYIGAVIKVHAELESLGQQHAHADKLIATLRTLPTALDDETLSHHLARAADSIVGGTGAAVTMWDGTTGTICGVDGDAPSMGSTFAETESIAALAARAGTALVREPVGDLPIVTPRERFAKKPKAAVCVPLRVSGETIAVLCAWSQTSISEHAQQDLNTLAPYAALQMLHARQFDALRSLAERDALTGLHNRHAFDQYFAAETARYERYKRPFALLMIDIDHFKAVNDRYSHEAGDFILQQVAQVIMQSLRTVDFAGRLGGEEFVVVLPETELTRGIEIAERIRRRTEELNPVWRGQTITTRVSVGVSGVPECVPAPGAIMRSADAALYVSKHGGRNRVTACEKNA